LLGRAETLGRPARVATFSSVADDEREQFERGGGSRPAGDRGEARQSLGRSLEELATSLEQAQEAAVAETERRVSLIAGERMGEALGEFRAQARQIAADMGRELEERARSLVLDLDETSRSGGLGLSEKVEVRLEERLRAGLEEARNDLLGQLRAELERRSGKRESRIEQETEYTLDSIRRAEHGAVKSIEAAMDRVREAGEAAAARAQASVASLTARVESAAKEMSRRSRRQELKLVREERSRRVEAALQGVDERAGSAKREIERAAHGLRADLMRSAGDAEMRLRDQAAVATAEQGHVERLATDSRSRLEAARTTAVASAEKALVAEGHLTDAERRLMEVGTRGEEALARIDQMLGQARDAENRLARREDRMNGMERRIQGIGESAARAAGWHERMQEAIRVEEEVARRITEAERRILHSVDEPRDPREGPTNS
jgi:hypothetical protein